MTRLAKTQLWNLEDLGSAKDIASTYGLTRAVICNWVHRYPDFPASLVTLATGQVYSRRQVAAWLVEHPNLGVPRTTQ